MTLILKTPECLKDKNYQISLWQDKNTIDLLPFAAIATNQHFHWVHGSFKNFLPGIVQAEIFMDKKILKTQFLFIFHPEPFQTAIKEEFSIGELNSGYRNYKPISLGFSAGKSVRSPFTLFMFSQISSDLSDQSLYNYLKNDHKIEHGNQMASVTHAPYKVPALAAITRSRTQDPRFFYAVPNEDPKDTKQNYQIYRLPENAGNTKDAYLIISTKISLLSSHPMMVIDATGTMIVIGNEIGTLDGYRLINR